MTDWIRAVWRGSQMWETVSPPDRGADFPKRKRCINSVQNIVMPVGSCVVFFQFALFCPISTHWLLKQVQATEGMTMDSSDRGIIVQITAEIVSAVSVASPYEMSELRPSASPAGIGPRTGNGSPDAA